MSYFLASPVVVVEIFIKKDKETGSQERVGARKMEVMKCIAIKKTKGRKAEREMEGVLRSDTETEGMQNEYEQRKIAVAWLRETRAGGNVLRKQIEASKVLTD